MAALTKPRKHKPVSLKQIKRVLATGEQAHEGGLACIDTTDGSLVAGQTGEGLVPIGIFIDVGEAGVTGDGTVEVRVRLFREVLAVWFMNATAGAAVADSHFASPCYILDDQTVTNSATGNSVAGRVWEVDATKGVLVEPAINMGLQGPQGEPGGGG